MEPLLRDVPNQHSNTKNVYENEDQGRAPVVRPKSRGRSLMVDDLTRKKLKFAATGIQENNNKLYISFGLELVMFILLFVVIVHISYR